MLRVLGMPTSINVRKVLWTCVELGLPFENEPWGGAGRPTDTPEFLALNPNGLVPVLIDGGLVLWESNTICRYLASREAREDLLPAGAEARARVEQWMDWQATELNNAWRHAFMGLVRRSAAHADAQGIAASAAAWNRHMAILDARLARSGAFVAGDTFTLADVVLGLSAHRWRSTPIERPELPAVTDWLARLAEREGFRRHCTDDTP